MQTNLIALARHRREVAVTGLLTQGYSSKRSRPVPSMPQLDRLSVATLFSAVTGKKTPDASA